MENLQIDDSGIDWNSIETNVTPLKEEQPETPKITLDDSSVDWDRVRKSKEAPDTGAYIGNRVLAAAGELTAGAAKIGAAAIHNLPLNPQSFAYKDKQEKELQDMADWVNDRLDYSFGMNPEKLSNATFGQKVGGALASAAPVIAAAAINPPAALASIVAPSYNRATELIRKHDVDAKDATTVFYGNAAVELASYRVGTLFPKAVGDTVKQQAVKYGKAALGTGVTNAGASTLQSSITEELLKHKHPELAASMAPSLEEAAVQFIAGTVSGPGFKYFHDRGSKTRYEKLLDQIDNNKQGEEFYQDSLMIAGRDLLLGAVPASKGTGIGLEALEKRYTQPVPKGGPAYLVWNPDEVAGRIPLIDFLADLRNSPQGKHHKNADLTELLNATEALDYPTLSKSFVVIHDGTQATSVKHGTPDDFYFGFAVPKQSSRKTYRDVIHEVGHAVSKGMIDYIHYVDTHPSLQLPIDSTVYTRYKNLEQAFFKGQEVIQKTVLNHLDGKPILREAEARGLYDPRTRTFLDWEGFVALAGSGKFGKKLDLYGWSNLKEFIAVAFDSASTDKTGGDVGGLDLARKLSLKPDTNITGDTNWKITSNALTREIYTAARELFAEGKNSFLKNMYDGVFQITQGQANLKKDANELAIRASKAEEHAKYLVAEVAKILDQARSKEDIEIDLLNISNIPQWKAFVKTNLDTILKNMHHIKNVGEAYNNQIKMDLKGVRGTTENYQTVDDLMESMPKDLSGQKDMETVSARWFSAPQQKNMMKWGSFVGKVLRFYHEQMNQNNHYKAKLYHSMVQHMDPYNKLSEFHRELVMEMAKRYDENSLARKEMQKKRIWWPDAEMVNRDFPNYPQKVRDAYLALEGLEDTSWKVLKAYSIRVGQEVPERIAGHMPKVWKGPFKVFIKSVEVDEKGNIKKERLEFVRDFESHYFANRLVKELQAGKYPGFEVQYRDTDGAAVRISSFADYEQSAISGIAQNQDVYHKFATLNPDKQAIIAKIDNDHAIGFQKHGEKRTNVGGWLGQFDQKFGILDELTGRKYREKRNILAIYEQYAKGLSDSYANAKFTQDVHNRLFDAAIDDPLEVKRPTYQHLTSRFNNLNIHIKEMLNNHTGVADNKLKAIDSAIANFTSKSPIFGVSPYLYRQSLKEVRNLMSIVFTRYSLGNWKANYFQAWHTFSDLYFVDMQRQARGLGVGNVGDVFTDITSGKPLQRHEYEALAWARDNDVLEPQAEYQVREKATTRGAKIFQAATLGNVPTKIEGGGRTLSFLIAYKYFYNALGGNSLQARQSAEEIMGRSMVNYDRSNRPLMYQSYGSVGELLSPFAVYRNAAIGKTLLYIKMMVKDPTNLDAWKPILAQQGAMLLTSGMLGMIGISEYDQIVRWLKGIAPEMWGDFPDARTMSMKWGLPDYLRFGLAQESTKFFPGTPEGVHTSGSAQMVGVDDMLSLNIVPFVQALLKTSGLVVRPMLGGTNTNSDKYQALTGVLPGQARWFLNEMFQTEGVNTQFAPTTLTGQTEFNIPAQVSQGVWGKPSTKTVNTRDQLRGTKTIRDKYNANVKKLVELAVDNIVSGNPERNFELASRANNEYGIDGKEWDQRVAARKQDREHTGIRKLLDEEPSRLNQEQIRHIIDTGGIR